MERHGLFSEGRMRRRDFITFVGGAAVTTAWPLILRAQESSAMRRMGALLGVPADGPEARVRVAAFLHGLQAVPMSCTNTRPNWLDLPQKLSSPVVARLWGRCFRRRAPRRSCSRLF